MKYKGEKMIDVPAWHLLWWKDRLEQKIQGPKNPDLTPDERLVYEYIMGNLDVVDKQAANGK